MLYYFFQGSKTTATGGTKTPITTIKMTQNFDNEKDKVKTRLLPFWFPKIINGSSAWTALVKAQSEAAQGKRLYKDGKGNRLVCSQIQIFQKNNGRSRKLAENKIQQDSKRVDLP
jgi:hypothetical protein